MSAQIIAGRFKYHLPTAPPPEPSVIYARTFEGNTSDFSALNAAQGFLASRGFSFGPGDAASRKSGILFGRSWHIAKWRNLTPLERAQCHGVLEGERRTGPVTIKIFFHAPAFALAALGSPEIAGAIVTAWDAQR